METQPNSTPVDNDVEVPPVGDQNPPAADPADPTNPPVVPNSGNGEPPPDQV